jgi:hypothetical protein
VLLPTVCASSSSRFLGSTDVGCPVLNEASKCVSEASSFRFVIESFSWLDSTHPALGGQVYR